MEGERGMGGRKEGDRERERGRRMEKQWEMGREREGELEEDGIKTEIKHGKLKRNWQAGDGRVRHVATWRCAREGEIKPATCNLKSREILAGKCISDQVKVYGKFDWFYRLFIPLPFANCGD